MRAASTRKLQTYPMFSLIWSMAVLTASNGRIVFSLAVAIKARRLFQSASLRHHALNACSHGSSGAIATIVLPKLRLCRLDCAHRAQRLIQPSRHEASAPFQRAEPPSLGSFVIVKGKVRRADYRGAAASAAGDAHMATDAPAVVAAIGDEGVG